MRAIADVGREFARGLRSGSLLSGASVPHRRGRGQRLVVGNHATYLHASLSNKTIGVYVFHSSCD